MDTLKEYYRKANRWCHLKLGKWDKVLHLVFGTWIAFCLMQLLPIEYSPIALFLPGVIGLIKEVTDINFDGADLASWILGGPIGVLLGHFI